MRYYLVRKDKIRRKLFYKYEPMLRLYKFLRINLGKNDISKGLYYSKLISNFPRDCSISRIKNRCIFTGRSRSIYSDFHLSRMQLRHLSGFGLLNGIKRSSW